MKEYTVLNEEFAMLLEETMKFLYKEVPIGGKAVSAMMLMMYETIADMYEKINDYETAFGPLEKEIKQPEYILN